MLLDCILVILFFPVLAPLVSASNHSLFDYEKIQFTDASLEHLKNNTATKEFAHLVTFASNVILPSPAECKTFPGDALWPAQAIWHTFDVVTGGALIPTVPIAAVCYDSQWGKKDLAKCNALIDMFTKPPVHENHPSSMMWPIYQGKTCMAHNITTPADTCTLGGYPVYAVNVSSVAQIQLAVNFARTLNICFVIKNTGHDYLGKSSGAGALSVWMHNLKDIEFLPEYTANNYSGNAFKVGAGVTVQEIYRAAHAHGISVQGGICESVGYVGGYLQGGGHNPLSGYYGMAADSMLAYRVVTADGRFVTASETSHPDLFWALRGGGGGTYGVVTSAVVKAHPDRPTVHATFVLGNKTDGSQTVSTEKFYELFAWFWKQFPTYTDAGTYSFFRISNISGEMSLSMRSWFAPSHTKESFASLSQPFFNKVEELGIPYQSALNITYFDHYFDAYWAAWGEIAWPLGLSTSLPGNRLIPRSNWENEAKLDATWKQVRTHLEHGRRMVAYFQAPQNRQNVDNGVASAWRHTQAFVITGSSSFAENASVAEIAAANKELQEVNLQPWRDLAPASEGGGSYLNEGSVDEPNWKEDCYGEPYAKLLMVKKIYDPTSLFYATTAVGSDEWEVRDQEVGYTTQNGKLCRVIS
ncbi:FAD binding domain-containing protein [Byssothecium circinans]|uniref:FAD binding domain-containing protein n=1 Tax=Byssothecium circinans TaxID=147558 RepID=A0A6A5UC93_9PLEO|nr:FAD binding domain-containing protein [Byssothecium circinans]